MKKPKKEGNKQSLAGRSPGKQSLAGRSPGKQSLAGRSPGKQSAISRSADGVVLVGGCFDVLHYGHIHFLKKARKFGSYLIVALESDKNIQRLKGNKRPIHGQDRRREMLESLRFVDQVIILADEMKDKDYEKLVKIVSPKVIAVTQGDPVIEKKRKQAEKIGAALIEIPKVKVPSTTKILEILNLER